MAGLEPSRRTAAIAEAETAFLEIPWDELRHVPYPQAKATGLKSPRQLGTDQSYSPTTGGGRCWPRRRKMALV